MQKNKTIPVSLLIALVGLPQISETIYTPALPAVTNSLHTTAYFAEMTLSIYFIGFALGVLLWGAISDQIGRRKAMLAGLLIYLAGTIFCGTSSTISSLMASRFLQAFGISVGSVITQTILRDHFTGAERVKLFSLISAALAFSPALGPVIGGMISEYLGWRANFGLLALLALLLWFWAKTRLIETRPLSSSNLKATAAIALVSQMCRSRPLWGHIFLIGSTNGALFGFYQEAPYVFIEQQGVAAGCYGFFGLLIAASTVAAARFSFQLSCRYAAEAIISYGVFFMGIGSSLLTLAVLGGLFTSQIAALAVSAIMLFPLFFGIGLIIPNSLSNALKTYQAAAGTAASLFGGAYYTLISGATWLMSFMHNDTALPLPLFLFAMTTVAATGAALLREKKITVERALT